jgi:hypothetical protein
MVRIVLGAIAGFIAWIVVWVGIEKTLTAIWPEWYLLLSDPAVRDPEKRGSSTVEELIFEW